jgi:hypothetical protein
MNPMPPKVIGRKVIYEPKVFLGYQKTLNPRGTQTLEGRRSQKK